MPESPRWLLSRGKTEDGVKLLKKMARVNDREIPQEVIKELQSNPVETEQESKENFLDLIKNRVLLVRVLIVAVGWQDKTLFLWTNCNSHGLVHFFRTAV